MTRTVRRLVLGLVLGAAVAGGAAPLVAPPQAAAQDAPGAVAFFDKQFAAMAKTCADKLWSVASDARSAQFFQFANETAQLILEDWDPDHAEARAMLGFMRSGKEWVPDPKANVQPQNMKNTKESQPSFDARVKKWKESRAKADQFIAAKYAQLGDECAAKGFAEQAKKAYERGLALDGNCEGARKGLGYAKLGKIWVTKQKADALKKAAEGKPVEGASALETGLGVPLGKIATPHFRVEDDQAKEALGDAAKALETLYAYYLADAGIDPEKDVFNGKVLELCVVSKKDTWDKWVDQFSNAKDKKWLKESNTYRDLAGFRAGTLRVETAEHVDTRDPLLHHAAHFLNWYVWKTTKYAWLDEGLAYYYTVKVQETTRTHCVAKEDASYAKGPAVGGAKDWTVSERWKPYLKLLVQKKGDEELRKILNVPLATLDLPSSVKAWGVVSYLMDTKRDRFLELIKALGAKPASETVEQVFERIFATPIEAVDKEWREYALRAY